MTDIKPQLITKQMAIAIAQPIFNVKAPEPEFHSACPQNCRVPYGIKPDVPCWWVIGSWGGKDSEYMLRSSHLVVISRVTGEILYDGDAGDEG